MTALRVTNRGLIKNVFFRWENVAVDICLRQQYYGNVSSSDSDFGNDSQRAVDRLSYSSFHLLSAVVAVDFSVIIHFLE